MPTIYEIATGAALGCQSVDAREILEASPDVYSATPPKAPDPLDHDKDGKKGGSVAGSEEPDPYHGLTVLKLRELAEERKVDLGDAKKRDDIIAALDLAAEEAAKTPVLTRTEIEADLTAMDIDFDPAATDDDLMAQRDAARAARDAA